MIYLIFVHFSTNLEQPKKKRKLFSKWCREVNLLSSEVNLLQANVQVNLLEANVILFEKENTRIDTLRTFYMGLL